MADLSVLPDQQTTCRMALTSTGKLEHTEPAEKERVASVPESSWHVRQSRLCQKEKSRLSRVPNRKVGESQD